MVIKEDTRILDYGLYYLADYLLLLTGGAEEGIQVLLQENLPGFCPTVSTSTREIKIKTSHPSERNDLDKEIF